MASVSIPDEASACRDEARRWNNLEAVLLDAGKASRDESLKWNNLASTAAEARRANQELAIVHVAKMRLEEKGERWVKRFEEKDAPKMAKKKAQIVTVRAEFLDREADLQQAVVVSTVATTKASSAIDVLVHKRSVDEATDDEEERPAKKARADEA